MKKRASEAERRYMDSVASLGCLICRCPAELHHIKEGKGIGQRASNFLVIPLCPEHHRTGGLGVAYHGGPRSFEKLYGSELDLLAQTMEEVFRNAGGRSD